MNISSRTPEGTPNQCHVCGSTITITPSYPANDAPCPVCGTLLFFGAELSSPARYARFKDSVRFPLAFLIQLDPSATLRAKAAARVHPVLTPIGIFVWMSLAGLGLDALIHFTDSLSRPIGYFPNWLMLIVPIGFASHSRWAPDFFERLHSGHVIRKWLSIAMLAFALVVFLCSIVVFGWGHILSWFFATGLAIAVPFVVLGSLCIGAQLVILICRPLLRWRHSH